MFVVKTGNRNVVIMYEFFTAQTDETKCKHVNAKERSRAAIFVRIELKCVKLLFFSFRSCTHSCICTHFKMLTQKAIDAHFYTHVYFRVDFNDEISLFLR